MGKERTFKRGEIREITALTARQVAFYSETPAKSPVVVPNGKSAQPGIGKRREYSRHNLLEFLVVRECNIYGLTVGKIKKVITDFNYWLDKGSMREPGSHWLVVRHKRDKKKKDVMSVNWTLISDAVTLQELKQHTSALFINIDELTEVAERA